jgi:hypothetical protein
MSTDVMRIGAHPAAPDDDLVTALMKRLGESAANA